MTDQDSLEPQFFYERPAMRPTARTWIKHSLLLALTFCTATIAGVMFPFGGINTFPSADPQTASQLFQFLVSLPMTYAAIITGTIYLLFTNIELLKYGLSFSLSLLFILISHEMGHYVACRIYKVDATLPFFIPTPPMIGPAGTFGAFIKILSPMPSRKAVFDIGVAGPIAGFVALIPVAIIGFSQLKFWELKDVNPANILPIDFAKPLFFHVLGIFAGYDLAKPFEQNPYYFAAWVGLLVTALNLIPSGQLDGGHAIYAVFGERIHFWTGRVAFIVMAVLSVVGMYFFNSPSGFLIAIILGVMMRIRHPRPIDQTPLDGKRRLIAILTLVIFLLCFVPFPIQIN
jgi:membrane-associated protease RseP (regulator of RpoE activity)